MIIDCILEYKTILKDSYKSNLLKDAFLADSIDKFKITKHRDGNYPAIITISGWRSEDKDNYKDWETSILKLYPDREWFHLEWNSEKIPFIDESYEFNTLTTIPKTIKKYGFKTLIFLSPLGGLTPITSSAISVLTKEKNVLINNYWHLAVRNSNHTGECLAKVLNACIHKNFILVGHSLGSRVIYNCLTYLIERGLDSNIQEVHLLGGAVGSDKTKWSSKTLIVKNKIYNYFSENDSVLKIAYRASMLTKHPIGLSKIENRKVINIDTSRLIKGHTEYIQNFHFIQNLI